MPRPPALTAMPSSYALLLTDLVDSTGLAEQLGPEQAAGLWARHDRLARDLIARWRGREIDKSDGLLVLFDSVSDAVGYAFAYHRGLGALDARLRARVGIHRGPLNLRPNPPEDIARGAKALEVEGLALPVAARVMAVARGGQTLLTAAARQALDDPPAWLREHGHWQLQGIAEPVGLVEVADLAGGEPPPEPPADHAKAWRVVRVGELWQPARDLPHSLPAERDSFVGRQDALQALQDHFAQGARLVTLMGIGGAGKTRLATHYAWSQRAAYPGGCWFIDLAQAEQLADIHLAVARGLGLTLAAGEPGAQLARAIAAKQRCLIVVDNFEQLTRHAEVTLGALLERAPEVRLLVTTRERLGIVGEETVALDPLETGEAVTLFLRRAQAARHGYAPDAEERAAIERLVDLLDGLPLAIELAAARVRSMSARALAERIHDGFDSLISARQRLGRQATMEAAFDWSWHPLSPAEKATLARLSVFVGGFGLAAAAAVVSGPDRPAEPGAHDRVDADDPIDTVLSLVDKSLVRRRGDDRFDLLALVREFAARHLRAPGKYAGSGPADEVATLARHWRHFAGLHERAAVAQRCADVHNLVAACRSAAAAGDAACATRALANAWAALRLTGPYRTAVGLATAVLALPALDDAQRAQVHAVAANALDLSGLAESARSHIALGLACATRAGAVPQAIRLNRQRARMLVVDGQLAEAEALLTENALSAQAIGDASLEAAVRNELGHLMLRESRLADARACYAQALALAQADGDRQLEGGVLGNLASLLYLQGDLPAARAQYERALSLAAAVGDQSWEGNARCNLGLLLQEMGDHAASAAQFEAALTLARRSGHVRLAYTVQCNLGLLRLDQQDPAAALTQLEAAVAGAQAANDQRAVGQFSGTLARALAHQGRHPEALATLARGESLLEAAGDRLSLGMLCCDRAEVALLAPQPSQPALAALAADSLATARRLAQALGCGPTSPLGLRLEAVDGLAAPAPVMTAGLTAPPGPAQAAEPSGTVTAR